MNDRKKWIAAGLLLLLGFGAYFAFRSPPARAPEAAVTVASAPSAPPPTPSETAAPIDSAPPEVASASDDAPPSTAAEPRDQAPAATRRASVAKVVEAPAPAKTADAGAPVLASAQPTVAAAPVYPALVGQFMNRVGPQFRLLRVSCTLDGQNVYAGPAGAVVEIFRKMPPPGDHNVTVVAEYQGNGGGVFSYFDGYKFSVQSSRAFTSKADTPTQVTVAAVEKGGTLTDFKDRLSLRINVR